MGKTGLCPICKAQVNVRPPSEEEVFEDGLMDILGPHKVVPAVTPPAPSSPTEAGGNADPKTKGFGLKKKSCWRCQ